MKWIGQHIWDFISRFRSDVYLEGTESGTIASGGNLGLDSNNKVVKSASPSGTIDLTSEVTGVLPVANGGTSDNTFSSNQVLTGNGTSAIQDNSGAEFGSGNFTFTSSTSSKPYISLVNSNTDNVGSVFDFVKTDDTGADDDDIGIFRWRADNAVNQGPMSFAKITGSIVTAADTDEAGKLLIAAATSNGSTSALQQALTATGHGTNNTVDIGLGYGAASTTTTAGDLTVTSGLTIGGHKFEDIDIGSEFTDTDDHIMSSGAIKEKIENYGYTTSTGDMTGVDISVGTGLDISQSNTTSGDYSSTISLDLTEVGVNGSANQLLTDDGDGTVTSESYLTFANSSNISRMEFLSDQDTGDKCRISTTTHGATTIDTIDDDASAAHLSFDADGDINSSSATNKISKTYDFHGTTFENTYSDGEASGTILKYSPGGDDTITASTLAYLRSNNGRWGAADADQASTSTVLLGVGLGGSAQTVGLLLEGFVRIASTEILNVPGSGEVDGLPVYVSTTDGHFDFTPPSGSGDIVRIVGYAIDDDSGDVLIYFKPDNTWVEIA